MRHAGALASPMKTVLVVDGESRCREVAAQILSNAGFQVLVARDGFQAVGVLSARWREIAALVVDTEMPGVHGWEVIRFARSKTPRIRILRLGRTADTAPGVEYQMFQALPALPKPFTPADLLGRVRARLKLPVAPEGARRSLNGRRGREH